MTVDPGRVPEWTLFGAGPLPLAAVGLVAVAFVLLAWWEGVRSPRPAPDRDVPWREIARDWLGVLWPYAVLAALASLAALAGVVPKSLGVKAAQLAGVLLAVRAVFAVTGTVARIGWIRRWEVRLAAIVWSVYAADILGWAGQVEAALERVDLVPGKPSFSLWALLSLLVTVTLAAMVAGIVSGAVDRRVMHVGALEPSTKIGISKFLKFALITAGILLGLNAADVDVTTLTVLTGAIGLGLGFGLQAIAANFVSGFVLLADKSIKPGDVISFTGTTGTSTHGFGWVEQLRARYVVVRDRDGVATLVPNQNLITNSVINWSYSGFKVRLRLPVRITYESDAELALKLLLEAASDHPRILTDPPPVSRLMNFEDYGMELEVRFWIVDPANGVNNVRSDVNRKILRLFRANRIKIPVAQRELRMLGPAPDVDFDTQGPIELSRPGED
ncbi:MAG: mechanosensitive ion channel [Steroidobacteraceae bacterium]|nr:mechanosensitive ion channel [Steroidobacteraceae bacterium]